MITLIFRPIRIRGVAACIAGGLMAIALPVHSQQRTQTPDPQLPLMRFVIVPPAAQPLRITDARDLAISPDGTHLVYIAGASDQPSQLMLRSIDQLDAVPLRGITEPRSPFFSPDGQWVGFFSQGELRKVSITGGPSITICRVSAELRGASWGPDGTIVFALDSAGTGLLACPAGGGEPRALTTPDPTPAKADATFKDGEAAHQFPSVLPDGRAVLFTIRANGSIGTARVAVAMLDLNTGKRKILIRDASQAEYVGTGHLVYAPSDAPGLRAVRFDVSRLDVFGEPIPVVDHLMTKKGGAANFSLSERGALVYVPVSEPTSPVWVKRQGGEEPIPMPRHTYGTPRLSPDGTRVALSIYDPERGGNDLGIVIWDLSLAKLTQLPMHDIAFPVWTPDGRRIVFASELGGGVANLYWQEAAATGAVERLTTTPIDHWAQSISPDGKRLVLIERTRVAPNWNLGLLPMNGLASPPGSDKPGIEPLLKTKTTEMNAEISPDGRWLAYQSDESGRNEVYVRPFPNMDAGHWQISNGGGSEPDWAQSGQELFYLDASGFLTSAPFRTTPSFRVGKATRVLYTRYRSGDVRDYDVSRDGQRFLMIKENPASIVVVLNWLEELKRRALTK